MTYPVSYSVWVSLVCIVSKKGVMTVIKNKKNKIIRSWTITRWRMGIDYRIINLATRKDHFQLPLMDQMLERLSSKYFYCFLDGYLGYNQINVNSNNREKTSFICPFGFYAYRRMLFGLCNDPTIFQRCMLSIFFNMIENSMEVFMDDFSVFLWEFGLLFKYFRCCLKICIGTNLILN